MTVQMVRSENTAIQLGASMIVSTVGSLMELGTQVAQLKSFFGFSANTSDIDFVVGVPFIYGQQSASWLGCLDSDANPSFCRVLASPNLLYPEIEKLKKTARPIVVNGGWANETESVTIALLNYIGYAQGYHKVNSTTSRNHHSESDLGFPLHYSTYTYQKCTEIGAFITGADEPQDSLPIISKFVTLEYATKACRMQLNLTGKPDSARLDKYGEYNVSYPRLMLVGGEADPIEKISHLRPVAAPTLNRIRSPYSLTHIFSNQWRPFTPLAARDTPTRLNYSSTFDQPWHLIPGATHCWDWPGVFADQKKANIPPDSIKAVHELEKQTFKRWLREWHDFHPNYDVYARHL